MKVLRKIIIPFQFVFWTFIVLGVLMYHAVEWLVYCVIDRVADKFKT